MIEDNRDSKTGYHRVVKRRVGSTSDECHGGMVNRFVGGAHGLQSMNLWHIT